MAKPTDNLRLTKPEAARRQLETAVEMWFHGGEPISIHTLAAAAHRVVHDVAEHRGLEGAALTDAKRLSAWGYHPQEYKKAIRKSETFFKHALNDPDEVHDFSEDETQFILWSAIDCYHRLASDKSPLLSQFMAWMGFKYPDNLSVTARNRFAGFPLFVNTYSRREFFECFREFDFSSF